MKIKYLLLTLCAFLPSMAHAGEWDINVSGYAQGLYGYSHRPDRFKSNDKNNHGVGQGDVSFSADYTFNDDYSASVNLDVMGGIDQELKDYNQGAWGEEAYLIADSPYGRLMLGQTFNVDAQFHEGAPEAGAVGVNNSDVVDFIRNPSWQRNSRGTRFATLNTTYINTDGVAPKVSYISPAYYNTMLGLTYVPDAYNRRGLVNKRASYSHDGGLIAALYSAQEFGKFKLAGSLGYAEFHDNDKEMSASLRVSRGNLSLGGGWRKTYIDGHDKQRRIEVSEQMPLLFDNYREGQAWDVGVGYEIGPYKVALSYFESKAERTDNKDKITVLSNQYQYNQYAEIYLAAAHVDFEGATTAAGANNQGYAFIAGVGLNF